MSAKVLGMPLAIFCVLIVILLLVSLCCCFAFKDRVFGTKPEEISDIGKRGRDVWLGKEGYNDGGSRA
jgi:sensor histidine kinase regulating citrate/malate metabolism